MVVRGAARSPHRPRPAYSTSPRATSRLGGVARAADERRRAMGSVEWLWHCPAGRLCWLTLTAPPSGANLYPGRTCRAVSDVRHQQNPRPDGRVSETHPKIGPRPGQFLQFFDEKIRLDFADLGILALWRRALSARRRGHAQQWHRVSPGERATCMPPPGLLCSFEGGRNGQDG
jgi:hypothetical protein